MKHIDVPDLPAPAGHYSPAVMSDGFVFVSGVLPDLASIAGEDSFARQVGSVFDKCELVLKASGCGLTDVVQSTVYLVGVANWGPFNALYAARFGAHRPARAVVPVPELHHGAMVEVQLVARVPAR